MQLCKLHKHALELEWSGGGRGGAEAEGVGGSQRWAEKGKGGHTMTLQYTCGWPHSAIHSCRLVVLSLDS